MDVPARNRYKSFLVSGVAVGVTAGVLAGAANAATLTVTTLDDVVAANVQP
jgi:hypothetical protein